MLKPNFLCTVTAIFVVTLSGQAFTQDTVAASTNELVDAAAWNGAAFGAERPDVAGRIPLKVLRQDHSVLQFGRSCIDTPLKIGTAPFDNGLGTHANSEIEVRIPRGAKSFRAQVGIDNNADTGGSRGSVQFVVEIGGKEKIRTTTLRGGEQPLPINVPIDDGAETLTLKVEATDDGASHDQADWADAKFEMADGSMWMLDDNQTRLLMQEGSVPFSFIYDGVSSRDFLGNWRHEVKSETKDDRIVDTAVWTDPATSLSVTAVVTTFNQFPAVDWVLYFENGGSADSPMLEDVQALDVNLRSGYLRNPLYLHELEGDACGENTFLPKTRTINVKDSISIAPTGGRPSSISAFPWFTLQYGDAGVITAVGWTGQWRAQFDRSEAGPARVRAGMELTHLVLHPGERIRTPRIVMLPWQGDRQRAYNQWRRLLLAKYVPQIGGNPAPLPTALQTFDRYNSRPGWATEAGQLEAVDVARQLGCNTYWFDAAWFPGNFPNGVGNWFCKPEAFPAGLKPVGDACAANGMRFVLWFEPERVAKGTQIAEEHPEFVLGGKKGGLFNLSDPAARQWLTDLLSKRIDEYGITFYRNDFNMDPLSYWRNNDAADRQGMTEIRYVEGLYQMWDELRARHPGLLIDNCSSGGRRIDIEMCSRSLPLWRSDTNCSAGHPDWNQLQTAALGQYVPLSTACVWTPTTYEARSAATGGLLCQFAYLDENFPMEKAKALVAEAMESQRFWYGDFYPLTPCTASPNEFVAYQFHRPDLDSGIVLAFRRRDCAYRGLVLGLSALRSQGAYEVEFIDEAGQRTMQTMTGGELAENLVLRVPEKESSLLVKYRGKD
ncbi:MAG TPA: alpha-galactosidase [Candidatus Bathyarchaeia archaeon]|nr:alpha-galactosidase [Candidatus Bathyarchaeia archaeon]